ncbi:MAG: pyridoxal phosphate-dependent aminotransferase [Firmicutes bacterium]|nr:pyridoxal phosphate-dependent aminotransferase [Bacillota bacterium]
MNNYLSKRAKSLSPSLTLAIAAKAKKLASEGIKVINFSVGEPDFNTPDFIVEAANIAMKEGKTKYTAASGIIELKKAVSQKLKDDNNLDYAPNQIVVSNGAKQSLHNAIQVLIDDGDEVIIPAPYWLTYPELTTISGGVAVCVMGSKENDYKITPEQLKKAITKKSKVLILNSPSNPMGTLYTENELKNIAKVVEKHDLFVISDEIYDELLYDGNTHYSIAQYSDKLKEKTVLVNGFSKSYAMTGWRIGYTASNKVIADAMDSLQSHTTSNPNTIAQWASVEALSNKKGKEFLKYMKETFDERRKFMVKLFEKMPHISFVPPTSAFYVMVDISKLFGKSFEGVVLKSAHQISEILLDNCKIATVPGEAFGASNFIRFSYSLSYEDIKIGLDCFNEFLLKIK